MGLQVSETTALFIVMAVALVVWLGILLYLWRLDKKVARLEREVGGRSESASRRISE